MKRPKKILRLITAIFLLGLFMAVHVAKAFHTHTIVSSLSEPVDGKETIQATSHCATCDYHFTKEGLNEVPTFELGVALYYQPVFLFYKSYLFSSIGLHYSDRGPPVLA